MVWYVLFILSMVLLFLLPLLPAILEWHYKNDAQALKVTREYDGNIAHFAQNFQQFLEENFASLPKQAFINENAINGVLDGGDHYQIIDDAARPEFSAKEIKSNSTSKLILGQGSLVLPDTMFFEKEIYAQQDITSGDWNVFRAILAHGDINLGNGCDVIRWAHSARNINVSAKSRLYGRISAERQIRVLPQTRFERLYAPRIQFGSPLKCDARTSSPITKTERLKTPDQLLDHAAERWLVRGKMRIPSSSFHRGNLVSRHDMAVGKHSFIIGSIKSNHNLQIEGNTRIDGAVVAANNIYIGPGSILKGPIVCEKKVVIAKGSVIGSPDKPTTITAPFIIVEEGVVIHGAVWARNRGMVAANLSLPKRMT